MFAQLQMVVEQFLVKENTTTAQRGFALGLLQFYGFEVDNLLFKNQIVNSKQLVECLKAYIQILTLKTKVDFFLLT